MTVLVIADHDNSALKGAVMNTVTAASALGDVHVLIAGKDCNAAAEQAAALTGVGKVLMADADIYAHALAETITPLVLSIAGD